MRPAEIATLDGVRNVVEGDGVVRVFLDDVDAVDDVRAAVEQDDGHLSVTRRTDRTDPAAVLIAAAT